MNRERREKEIQEKSKQITICVYILRAIFKTFWLKIIFSFSSEKARDSVQYFLRNNTQYRLENDLNDLGTNLPWLLHHYDVIVHYIINILCRKSHAEALV